MKHPVRPRASRPALCALAMLTSMAWAVIPGSADAQDEAAASYAAFNSAFLVGPNTPGGAGCNNPNHANGNTYYSKTLTRVGTAEECNWVQAMDIALSEDVYDHTHSPAQQQLISAMLNTFITDFGAGKDWSYDGWDDDIAWMVNAFVRGYRITGNTQYLTIAENNWNTAYNRGWDSTLGGGIWENGTKQSKNALSNDPMIFNAVNLYQATGDSTYLTKAINIYAWVRANLFNTGNVNTASNQPGQVNGSINLDGSLGVSRNAFDSGTFIEAANALHRVTRNPMYYNDAVLAATFAINQGKILHNTQEGEDNQWAYWLARGLSDFATQNNLWSTYYSYLLTNANQAWSERNALNLTWNNWSSPTKETNPNSFEMSSAAAIWQVLPPANPQVFSGNFELRNKASGLSLNVSGSSLSNSAAIVQAPLGGGTSGFWTITPTSGGYYQIKNVASGLLLNVAAVSGQPGAKLVQWPAGDLNPGNDQWWPVQNADGTYSFFNAYSGLVLEDPGGSKSSGTQVDQWGANGGSNQEFTLIAH